MTTQVSQLRNLAEDAPAAQPPGARKLASDAGLPPALIYAGLAAAMGAYVWRVMGAFTRFPGTRVDARFNQTVLEHLWLWATGRADSLSDTEFFYPYRDGLWLSDTHFGSAAVYLLSRALGLSREVAFDVWWLAGMAATFAATFYVLRRFGLPAMAAAFGATVFTFSLPMLAQDAHAQLIYRFPVPLATLACVEAIRTWRPRAFAALALWVGWQFLCSVYIGVFLCEWLALFGAACLFLPALTAPAPSRAASRAADVALFAAAALACGLAGWMLWRHASVAREFAIHRSLLEVQLGAPTWKSLLSQMNAPTDAWLTERLRQEGPFWIWEHQLFPGFGVVLLAGIAAARARDGAVVAACLIATAGLLLIAMDFGGFGLYRWLAQAPGLNAIRSPGRVALVYAFALSWLAAMGFAELRRSPWANDRLWFAAALALALVDIGGFHSASTDIARVRAEVAQVEAGLDVAKLRAERAVLLGFVDKSYQEGAVEDLDLMIAAQDLGLATANGYSGSTPPQYDRPRNCAEAKAWIAGMDALPFQRTGAGDVAARAVIVPPGACPAQ